MLRSKNNRSFYSHQKLFFFPSFPDAPDVDCANEKEEWLPASLPGANATIIRTNQMARHLIADVFLLTNGRYGIGATISGTDYRINGRPESIGCFTGI